MWPLMAWALGGFHTAMDVLMTNPPPGLALAVIGANPQRGGQHSQRGTTMSTSSRRRSTDKKTKRNPNALYWKVGPQIPWKPWRASPQALKALVKSNDVNLSKLARPQRASTPTPRKPRPAAATAAPARPPLRVVRAASKPTIVVHQLPARRPTRAGRKGTKRNPPEAVGLGADFAGLGAALTDLGRNPKGFLWLGGGAAGTMIAGGIVGAQLGRVLPEMKPGIARMVNAITYAGTAVLLSRLPRDASARRQVLAGGLAIALWELAMPGATTPMVAKLPGIGALVAPADAKALARVPALQANPTVKEQAVAAAQPWYRSGGNWNPVNWLSGADDGDPASIDGIAAADGRVHRLTDGDMDPTMAGTGGNDDADMSSMSGVGAAADAASAPLMTYLGDLGCPSSGHGNDLTELVRV